MKTLRYHTNDPHTAELLTILVGPKISPPFDSAYSSIGFNMLKALAVCNIGSLALVSSYDFEIYRMLYNKSLIELIRGCDFLPVLKSHTCASYFIDHTWSYKDSIRIAFATTKVLERLSELSKGCIVLFTLLPTLPISVSLLVERIREYVSKTKIHVFKYLFWMPPKIGADTINSLKCTRVLVSSHSLLHHLPSLVRRRSLVLPPPIDTNYYRPLPRTLLIDLVKEFEIGRRILSLKERGYAVLLYMGPVHPDRFPMHEILKILRYLKLHKNIDVCLVIVTTIRRLGLDDKYVNLIEAISRKLVCKGLDLMVYVNALSEQEKLFLYNLADVVLYPVVRPWEMTIPPLTILEAYACAKPVVFTSRVPGYTELIPAGFDCSLVTEPTAEGLSRALEHALDLSEKECDKLRLYCVRRYSIDVVAKELRSLYDELQC